MMLLMPKGMSLIIGMEEQRKVLELELDFLAYTLGWFLRKIHTKVSTWERTLVPAMDHLSSAMVHMVQKARLYVRHTL
jgi:hypothetical protein